MTAIHLSFAERLVANCVGCGHEPAVVTIGDPRDPDETYGRRCWADASRWRSPRPAHTHLDGHDCEPVCATGEVPHDLFETLEDQ